MMDGQQTVDTTTDTTPRTSIWRNKFFWLSLMLAVGLVITAYFIHSILAAMLGIVSLLFLLSFTLRGKSLGWGIGLVVVASLFFLYVASSIRIGYRAYVAESKQNLHAIQYSIERYAVDHDYSYPLDFAAVMEQGYLPKTPTNPYRRSPETKHEERMSPEEWEDYRHMQPLGVGVFRQLKPETRTRILGDFVYLPRLQVSEDGAVAVVGYDLCVFVADVLDYKAEYSNPEAYWLSSIVRKIPVALEE